MEDFEKADEVFIETKIEERNGFVYCLKGNTQRVDDSIKSGFRVLVRDNLEYKIVSGVLYLRWVAKTGERVTRCFSTPFIVVPFED